MKTTITLAMLAIFFSYPLAASGALIAWDSFAVNARGNDYDLGSIANENPSVGLGGFSGPWSIGTAAFEITYGGLNHPLTPGPTYEGQLVSFTSSGSVGGGKARNLYRLIDYTPSTGTYYMSLLINKGSASEPRHMFAGLGAVQGAETGVFSVEGAWIGGYNGGIWFAEGPGAHLDPVLAESNMNFNETYFMLLQYDFSTSGTDSVTATIYDSSSQIAAGPQVFGGVDLDASMGQFSLLTQDFGPNPAVDEMRFGTQLADVMVLPPNGDYDGDHDIDGQDFLVWQRGDSPTALSQSELTAWAEHYGNPVAMSASSTIPEPMSLAIILTGSVLCSLIRWPQSPNGRSRA